MGQFPLDTCIIPLKCSGTYFCAVLGSVRFLAIYVQINSDVSAIRNEMERHHFHLITCRARKKLRNVGGSANSRPSVVEKFS
jgi:hypothetical protein